MLPSSFINSPSPLFNSDIFCCTFAGIIAPAMNSLIFLIGSLSFDRFISIEFTTSPSKNVLIIIDSLPSVLVLNLKKPPSDSGNKSCKDLSVASSSSITMALSSFDLVYILSLMSLLYISSSLMLSPSILFNSSNSTSP